MDEIVYLLEDNYIGKAEENGDKVVLKAKSPLTNKKNVNFLSNQGDFNQLEETLRSRLKNNLLKHVQRVYGQGLEIAVSNDSDVNWDKLVENHVNDCSSMNQFFNEFFKDTSDSNWDNLVHFEVEFEVKDMALYASYRAFIPSVSDFELSGNLSEGVDLTQGHKLEHAVFYAMKSFDLDQVLSF